MRQILDLITVSFNSKGGSPVPDQNLLKGWKVTRPDDPRKDNEKGDDVFEGWYDETFEHEWDFDDIPTADMVLYAKWTVLPENGPEKERWSDDRDPESTVNLKYEFDPVTGVCKITVTGKAMEVEGEHNQWRARVNYLFTAQANTHYTFVVEAWKDEGDDHWLDVQYYYDDDAGDYRDTGAWITSDRKTFTLISEMGPIEKGGVRELRFQCADQTGIICVKINSITPVQPKMLAVSGIQNFLYDDGMIGLFSAGTTVSKARQAAGNYCSDNNDWDIIVAGSSLSVAEDVDDSTANFPLKIKDESLGNVVWWTGGGLYKIGMLAYINNEPKFFWSDEPVDFSNAVTPIQFSSLRPSEIEQ